MWHRTQHGGSSIRIRSSLHWCCSLWDRVRGIPISVGEMIGSSWNLRRHHRHLGQHWCRWITVRHSDRISSGLKYRRCESRVGVNCSIWPSYGDPLAFVLHSPVLEPYLEVEKKLKFVSDFRSIRIPRFVGQSVYDKVITRVNKNDSHIDGMFGSGMVT